MIGIISKENSVRMHSEDPGSAFLPCVSMNTGFTKQVLTVDSLPVEMIQKIATFLSTKDYDNLRATNRTLRHALISINGMHDALSEKNCNGALGAFYKTCVEAKHLAARCDALTEDEINTLLNIRVQPEPQWHSAVSIQFEYPLDDLTLNDGILDIVEALCHRLVKMTTRNEASSCSMPSYKSEAHARTELGTLDTLAEVIFHASDIRKLSQINDLYACAYALYGEFTIAQRIFLAAMMVKLQQFWQACPPTGLDRQAVDKVIRTYVTLLRSGNDVLTKCMEMKINNPTKTSTKPQGITEKTSCG